MKHIFATVLLAAACLMVHTGASAQDMMQATIPFDFTVGQKLLPAGRYTIAYVQPRLIALDSRGKHATFASITSRDDVSQNPHKLVFNKYGNQYFLSEIRGGLGESAWKFGISNLEKRVRLEEAALQNQQKTVVALK